MSSQPDFFCASVFLWLDPFPPQIQVLSMNHYLNKVTLTATAPLFPLWKITGQKAMVLGMTMPKPIISLKPPALREVSLKVAAVNGINLGQGVCKMPVPELVLEAARKAISDGQNLYGPAQGVEELRAAVSEKLTSYNKATYPTDQIVISAGSTGAFESICHALLSAGDEVISFRPYYPYHHNALTRAGVSIKYVELTPPNWKFELDSLKEAISPRTKFILLNSPNNPTGKVFTKNELEGISALCIEHDLLCVTDEVYEYMTYEGSKHTSIASFPGMNERCILMGSYSKTFAITGWRIGYAACPKELFAAVRVASDQLYVCAPTPFQYAVATGIRELGVSYYSWLTEEYTRKRKLCGDALRAAGLNPILPEGAYYIVAEIGDKFNGQTSDSVIDDLIKITHVGAVPASDFIGAEALNNPAKGNFFRFCYAVPDELLIKAGESLARL